MESPREGPIFNCSNGHILCRGCVHQVPRCPVCREPNVTCRNLFAEEVLQDALKHRRIRCRSTVHGCNFKALLPAVKLHEENCGFNQVGNLLFFQF